MLYGKGFKAFLNKILKLVLVMLKSRCGLKKIIPI